MSVFLGASQTIKNLSLKTINNTALGVPSTQEQQKVADCLSSLDTLINAQTEKLETLQLHKKGLVQGLFPSLNSQNVET